MDDRTIQLSAFAEAVAVGDSEQFARLVKAAYQAGATRDDLLAAVEMGRLFGEPSGPVLSEVFATIHAWHWIAVRRLIAPADRVQDLAGGEYEKFVLL